MKILKFIGGFILILIVAVLLLGLVMKKEYTVERSIEIDAPKQIIWKNIYSFRAQNQWSPWRELDPNQKTEYFGEDGEVGSGTKWEGDPETVGTGSQELLATTKFERIESKLKFIIPWEAENDVFIAMEPVATAFKVSWGFKGAMDYPMNVFLPLMGMEKYIGQDFEKGLAKLKGICENQTSLGTYKDWEIKLVDLPIRYFAAVRDTVNIPAMDAFLRAAYGSLYGGLAKANIEPQGPAHALYYSWDEANNRTFMAAAVPIKSGEFFADNIISIELPASKGVLLEYKGDYSKMEDAHWAIDECFNDWGFVGGEPAVEEYLIDNQMEEDPSKWVTNITYSIIE